MARSAEASCALLVVALAVLVCYAHSGTVFDELPILVLNNTNGMQVHLTPVGATIQKLLVPGNTGNTTGSLTDVALGYDNITLYTVSNTAGPGGGSEIRIQPSPC